MKFEFTKDVTVEGTEYKAGHQVDASQIPAGSVQSLLYVGHCVEVVEPKSTTKTKEIKQ